MNKSSRRDHLVAIADRSFARGGPFHFGVPRHPTLLRLSPDGEIGQPSGGMGPSGVRWLRRMKTIQVGSMISENGRAGKVEAPDSELIIDFSREEEGRKVTPEHLFAGAYAACFHSALKSAAERGHFHLVGSVVTANVRLKEDARGGYQLDVELAATMPGISESDAEHLLHQAHSSCPYSKALRGNADVRLKLD